MLNTKLIFKIFKKYFENFMIQMRIITSLENIENKIEKLSKVLIILKKLKTFFGKSSSHYNNP